MASCDIYLGLFGDSYGFEDAQGVSPTEHEFNCATDAHKARLIYVKGETDQGKHPKMQALIQHASNQVIRRRFTNSANLHPAVYASLVDYLQAHELLRFTPFDASACRDATLFELVDQTVNFVLSKINLAVGTRALSAQAPTAYEIPPEVVSEAIVNAIAHRDYTSTASVQVMLFADRLEVWNPGGLPPGLSLQSLRQPHGSYPANPLMAEPLYLAKYIERMGTGTGDMIERCTAHGLKEPSFTLTDGFVTTIWRRPELALAHVGRDTQQVTEQVNQLLKAAVGEKSRAELMAAVGLKARVNFSRNYLEPALAAGLIERTLPDSPNSPTQKYRLTPKGHQVAKG